MIPAPGRIGARRPDEVTGEEGDAAGLGLVEPSGCHKIKGSTNALGAKPAGADRAGGATTPKPSRGTATDFAGGVAGTTLGVPNTDAAPLWDWGF
ncbi:MAG: hypothetical protein ACK5QQ_09670 [Cyanobacteriota bacterium]